VPAGVVVDRIAKRKLMIACDAARMLIIGSVPVGAPQLGQQGVWKGEVPVEEGGQYPVGER
jgi:hypothetical protein